MGSLKIFLCSLAIIILILDSSYHTLSDNNSIKNITFLGDAHVQENGRICLTSYSLPSTSSSAGVGRAIYKNPIRFRNSSPKSTASFSSKFTFTIIPNSLASPPRFGDGLTFLITSNPHIIGNGFGFMGLSNETCQEPGIYIAVEFDTSLDSNLEDISDNHVGIDINSVISYPAVDSTVMGFDLKNGKNTTAWIDYLDSEKLIKVWLSYDAQSKPIRPIISTSMDLSGYIDELMYIGFTASNGEIGSAKHFIENWEFETYFPPFDSVHKRVQGGCIENGHVSTLLLEVAVVLILFVGAIFVRSVKAILRGAWSAISEKMSPHQSGISGANQTTSDSVTDAPVISESSVNESTVLEEDLKIEQGSSTDTDDSEILEKKVISEADVLETLSPSTIQKDISTAEYRIEQLENAAKMSVTKGTKKDYTGKLVKLTGKNSSEESQKQKSKSKAGTSRNPRK
ncbi:hypothetical protein C5167_030579 [Papaver somniferum]|uniref:L-type lectin-domain containing receptor kinase S.6-like n=1 Tax=Papaver somniferum TaxID=3469 RepID=UPI000E705946|nr:L-type lectin-domain containing receptor kinase S.6-like [Papaver somniferum]RZC86500.1 hypothetical protein C5167_030579 [Papaver somniferum]